MMNWSRQFRDITKQDVINGFLKPLNLIQEPPRVHTIFFRGQLTCLAFPWVSIGAIHRTELVLVHVYFHNVQWHDLDEAFDILRLPPDHTCHLMSTTGRVCVGGHANDQLVDNKITPSQAFWMTEFRRGNFPESMYCLESINPVLSVHWSKTYWQYSENLTCAGSISDDD